MYHKTRDKQRLCLIAWDARCLTNTEECVLWYRFVTGTSFVIPPTSGQQRSAFTLDIIPPGGAGARRAAAVFKSSQRVLALSR